VLTKSGDAIIDILAKYADFLIKEDSRDVRISYSIPSELPELETDEDYRKRLENTYGNDGDKDLGGDSYSNNYSKRGGRSYNDYLQGKSQRGGRGGGFRGGSRSWGNPGSRGGRSSYR